MSAIIPNITSYSHSIDGSAPYPTPFQHVGVTMSEPTNGVLVTATQPESTLPFHCEVCKISCNTKDVLEVHKQGKKHLKSVKKLTDSSANGQNMVPPPVASENLVGELTESSASAPKMAPMPPPVESETIVGELENKKHRLLQNGATAETLIYCEICNVVCNNQEVFNKHVAGKKHSAKSIVQQASTNGVFDSTSDSSGLLQKKPDTFPCEICKITCTSNELLKMHIAGKKHLKKVKDSGQISSLPLTPIASQDTSPTKPVVNPESIEVKTNLNGVEPSNQPVTPVASQDTPHTKPVVNPESIEVKTNLNGAELSNQPVTPVASQDTPHTKPVVNLESIEVKTNLNGVELSNQPVTPVALQDTLHTKPVVNPESIEVKTVNLDGAEPSNLTPPTKPDVNPESNEGKTVNLHGVKSLCELCGVICDTNEMLKIHKSGKKHRKNLEKSERLIGPNPAVTAESAETPKVTGPLQEDAKTVTSDGPKTKRKKSGNDDDLETKKQRLLQSGTASDAVQICNLCNVVCNSPKAFTVHLAGQKHVAMAVKQTETQAAAAAGQES